MLGDMSRLTKPGQLKLWIRAMRAPFFQAVMIPAVLGTTVAWYRTGVFHLGYFLLAFLGVVFIHAGTNLANEYFDHKSEADDINKEFTAFSGGSRVIQEGLISPKGIYKACLLFFGLGTLVGLYLVWVRGWPLLVIGAVGLLSGYFYTGLPIKVGYRGFGELLVGLNCGPLVVLGAYYVQAKSFSLETFVASVPVGLLIVAVLYINQFPDYHADKMAKKNTLVVIMGRDRAIKGFYLLLVSAYFVIVLGAVTGMIPWLGLVSLLTLPLAWKTMRIARANYTDTNSLKPAMFNTIVIHLMVGLLLSFGYLMARMFV
jgi:1,4-dihydroxy-2-naphthoate octaprenyltransferase